MLTNYFKIAWRNITRHKLYSFINIGGLGIGMAVSFMLLLYVYNEFTFNKYHEKGDRIYQLFRNQAASGELITTNGMSVPIAAAIRKDFPELEKVARTNWAYDNLFGYKNKSLKLEMISADPDFLDIFTIKLLKGKRQDVFSNVQSVIISESAAKALFGTEDPIGKTLKFNTTGTVMVSGLYKDLPENGSFKFKVFGSWAGLEANQPWVKNYSWGNFSFKTYALVKPGIDVARLNAKLAGTIEKYNSADKENKLFLYPFERLHLYSEFKNGVSVGGAIQYVRLFMFLALGILLIACINFMNLSTARSENRAREVGVRKVVGARRFAIVKQFLGESLLMSAVSFVFAIVLVTILLDYFNSIIHKNLAIPYHLPQFWIAATGIILITGIIAGSYPALFLSSFKPVKVLKGLNKTGNATLRPRQVLVTLQFVFATCLILSTILIYKQIQYIKNKPAGYDRNGVIEVSQEGKLYDKFELFRRDAIEAGAIVDGSATSGTISTRNSSSWGITWPGQLPGEDKTPIDQIVTTYHFTNTFGVKMAEGRDFEEGRPSDTLAILMNEAAVKLMRLKSPLGTKVKWQGQDRVVIGIMKDFIQGSPSEPINPLIVGFMKDWNGTANLRLNSRISVSSALSKLEAVYKKYNPEYPFEYKFLDELYGEKFRTEQLLGTLANSFTVLAIVISCLGLFGLASFSAEQRRKEIGIRKVLGATTAHLWYSLSKEFVVLVLIAFVIGAGVSYYFMSDWLSRYTYHTDISPWVFAATILISLLVTLTTVSWQAIKAALSNPVKSLRSE
ncbi:ABC transporter permease [Mucilaginibacter terrenus]|uniref:ABC transporter permease n=1 Tax=Mucilaginibacter terrenus TaxID=2482727 RepID=A0A3E2NTZ3_9SPHI|nr:ABC transporter permease [Mucilaginibacter terrenus]RFZ84483.1 ABC transporter permease [Mucilaginibacter terrenus]